MNGSEQDPKKTTPSATDGTTAVGGVASGAGVAPTETERADPPAPPPNPAPTTNQGAPPSTPAPDVPAASAAHEVETIGADPVQPTPAAPSAAPGAMEGPVRPGAQHEPANESATNPAPPAETTPAHAETQSAVHAGAPAVAAAPSPTPGPQPHQSAPNPVAVATITLPNLLTAFRCVMVFLIVVLLMWPWGPLLTGALVVFAIAAATDWLDGVLARAFNLQTDLGRMLDHIADKLLVCVTMLCLCATGVIDGLNVLAVALILSRELAISGLREHLGARGVVVPSTMFGKWKTTFQMVAVAALLAAPLAPLAGVARFSGLMILWVAMVLTVASGVQYALATREAWGKS